MPAFLIPIFSALGKVPWQAWAATAILLSYPPVYCAGHSDGKQVILERLHKAEEKAAEKAEKAATSADEKQQAKTEVFEAEQDALRKAIDDAKASDENPLDAIF
jgi:hypothetical protein